MDKNKKAYTQDRADEDGQQPDENIVYGRNAVRELLKSGRVIEKIYIQRGARDGSVTALAAQAAERGILTAEADRRRLDEMTAGGAHRGICAVAAGIEYSTLDDILGEAQLRGERAFIVIADGVEDPHNLGAIMRSCECAGVHGLIIPKHRACAVTPTVIKASAGAASHLRICKATNISACVDELKKRGVWIFGAEAEGSSIYESDFNCDCAVVVGSEGAGISRLVLSKCDFTVSIPMYGRISSLNVSCACAVVLNEAARQRHK